MSRRHLINSSDVFFIKGFTVVLHNLHQMEGSDDKKLTKQSLLKLKTVCWGTFLSFFSRIKGLKNNSPCFLGNPVLFLD